MRCARGHSFDRARQGYWNLLQPQDKKSLNPGDTEEAVLARHRWLERGHAESLVQTLREWIPDTTSNYRTLDLGCGEGAFGPALFPQGAEQFCGIDMSRRAIRLAVRRWPQATWILANADRELPAMDQSVDFVLSLFGRRPASEIARVLTANGRCIVAVPGEEDLIELRQKVQQTGERRSRWELVAEEMRAAGLEIIDHLLWKQHVELEPDEIRDALAMTYRAVRHSEQQKLASLESMSVTLAADLLLVGPQTEASTQPSPDSNNPDSNNNSQAST